MVNSKAWLAEVLWLTITAVLVILVIWPIRHEIYGFPFEKSNIYFIICCVTGLRWLLLLPSTPFAKSLWIKLILIFLCIWLFIFSFNVGWVLGLAYTTTVGTDYGKNYPSVAGNGTTKDMGAGTWIASVNRSF